MTTLEPIVAVEAPPREKSFLGISLRAPRVPQLRPDAHLYASAPRPDGIREFTRITVAAELPALAGAVLFYHVSLAAAPFAPTFSAAVNDSQNRPWDCRLAGRVSVTDSRRFLESFAATIAAPNSPLTAALAESWFAHRIAPNVRDAIRAYALEDLRDKHALPPAWWEKQLAAWLADFGITVRIEEVAWSSAQAAAAEADAARQRDLAHVAQARQEEHEAQLREAAARAAYELRKKQIENDQTLSAHETANQLQLLEKKHRKELIEADTQIENARRDAEKAALAHERELARLRQDITAVQQSQERARQAETQHTAILEELRGFTATLAKLSDLPDHLLAKLADRDAHTAHAAAERIVSPEFNLSASTLAGMGFHTQQQSLLEHLRAHAAADGHPISIRKTDLVTRDIGTARVHALPINTTLQFQFTTARAGFVTLLNIGTSGNVYVHVPNAYTPLARTQVPAGAYAVPGPELLPWDRLQQLGLDYLEVGPPGWEHLVVLVSDRPLLPAHTLAHASPENPFIKLTLPDLSQLCAAINAAPPDTWSAGVLSFLVG